MGKYSQARRQRQYYQMVPQPPFETPVVEEQGQLLQLGQRAAAADVVLGRLSC